MTKQDRHSKEKHTEGGPVRGGGGHQPQTERDAGILVTQRGRERPLCGAKTPPRPGKEHCRRRAQRRKGPGGTGREDRGQRDPCEQERALRRPGRGATLTPEATGPTRGFKLRRNTIAPKFLKESVHKELSLKLKSKFSNIRRLGIQIWGFY